MMRPYMHDTTTYAVYESRRVPHWWRHASRWKEDEACETNVHTVTRARARASPHLSLALVPRGTTRPYPMCPRVSLRAQHLRCPRPGPDAAYWSGRKPAASSSSSVYTSMPDLRFSAIDFLIFLSSALEAFFLAFSSLTSLPRPSM